MVIVQKHGKGIFGPGFTWRNTLEVDMRGQTVWRTEEMDSLVEEVDTEVVDSAAAGKGF